MHSGWFKFHRKIFDNPICTKDSDHFYLWCYLLAEACCEEQRAIFKNEDIILKRGQLITTTKYIAAALKINESKVYRILKKFEIEKQIEKRTSNEKTLISLVNWEMYQENEKQNEERVKNECKTNEEPFCKGFDNAKSKRKTGSGKRKKENPDLKNKYGEYQHVTLTDLEYLNLSEEFGADLRDRAIRFLDEYIEEKGYKSDSSYLTIKRWVIRAVKEKEQEAIQAFSKTAKAQELDDFYRMANDWAKGE